MDRFCGFQSMLILLAVTALGFSTLVASQDAWEDWSKCSRRCGGGISYQLRKCDNETKCAKPHIRYRMCNIQDCPEGSTDFRSMQCAQYNDKPYKGKRFKWMPVTSGPAKCELNCMPKGYNFYVKFASKVIDGTRCADGSLDVCVNGTCQPVGCDMVLYSSAKFDNCRVCKGRNDTCNRVSGSFTKQSGYDYMEVANVPVGSTNIRLWETSRSRNYIAIRENGKYLLNGNWRITSRGGMKIHDSYAEYLRNSQIHELRIDGPTTAPLILEALVISPPVTIKYEYYVPNDVQTADLKVKYQTRVGEWSACSKPCAGGVRRRRISCESALSNRRVARSFCEKSTLAEKEPCNTQPCNPEWYTTDWSPCSTYCGEGKQVRRVHCVRRIVGRDIQMLRDGFCPGVKPSSMRSCTSSRSCSNWVAGNWGECSQTCNGGYQIRSVVCNKKRNDAESCKESEKPLDRRACNTESCDTQWVTGEWSECSANCGKGMRSRQVTCKNRQGKIFANGACNIARKPRETEECQVAGPCPPMWHATQWSKCTRKCSNGYQMRTVFCAEKNGNSLNIVSSSLCKESFKMPKIRKCKQLKPCFAQYFTSPWKKCSASCNGGYRLRVVRCYADSEIDYSERACAKLKRPAGAEMCNTKPCPGHQNVRPTVKVTAAPTRPKPITGSPAVPARVISITGPRSLQTGEAADFICNVFGEPKPVVTWTLNSFPIRSSDPRFQMLSEGRSLTITEVKPEDEGLLTCYARNTAGSGAKSERLQVAAKPKASLYPTRQTSNVGDALTVTCRVSGRPAPRVQWRKNGVPFRGESSGRVRLGTNNISFRSTVQSDTGTYECIAENNVGKATARMALTVEERRGEECVDRSANTNCVLIKSIGFCSHSYYSKVCCKTCTS